jgi:hypothetical protein
MTDKNILVVVSSESQGKGLLRFVQGFVTGDNLHLTLCIFDSETGGAQVSDEFLDDLSMVCISRHIPLKIKRLSQDPHGHLAQLAQYADLLVMEKSALRHLALGHDFEKSSCALLALPDSFEDISNILLISDGSKGAIRAKKQFFQTFPRWFGNPDVTLLNVSSDQRDEDSEDEILLLDYLKQYSRNVGILKVEEPLTKKILRPLRYDKCTVVVGTMDFLLSHYGEDDTFKPFFDEHSTLFLPAN